MTDLQRPWLVPPAATMTAEDYLEPVAEGDEDSKRRYQWLSLYTHSVTRPGVRVLDRRITQGALHAVVPPTATSPAWVFGPDVGTPVTIISLFVAVFAFIAGTESKRSAALLTPEANKLWELATLYGGRILDAAKGTVDEDATRSAVVKLQADILDSIEVASRCEFTIWRMLKFDTPGLLKFATMPDRDINVHLVGDRLVEALDLDECRIEHLLAAAPGIQALVNLAHYTSESAVNRRRYADAVGEPAPVRVIDTEAVDQLTELYASDAEAVAALPQ